MNGEPDMAKDIKAGEAENESLEDSIFKSLSNQKRRDILRVVGERKQVAFTEIKNQAEIEDTPTLSYHLNALSQLLQQRDGKYQLTELGNDTYNLLVKITTYSTSATILNYLRRRLPVIIITNAVLWAAALFAVSAFEGRPHFMTIASFAVLWFISNIILYTISQRVRK